MQRECELETTVINLPGDEADNADDVSRLEPILRVDLAAQFIAFQDEIRDAVCRVLASGKYVLGAEVAHFEKEFANYLGAARVVAVADGTHAISLALKAAGVRPGDEV